MNNKEAIKFGKEQLEIFGKDSTMYEFLEFSIKALEERPKGKWVHDYDDFYKCSLCGRGICTNWENEPYKHYPFCHCGADMRGDV